MKTVLIDLFTSKKFLAALSAVAIYIAGRFGFDVEPAALDRIFAALLVYVGAQGLADNGKSAAAINAVAGNPGGTIEAHDAMRRVAQTVAVLALVAFAGATMPACASAKPRIAAGVNAFLDCEDPNLRPAWLELYPLARSALNAVFAGGRVDGGALLTDLRAAKSDAPRCAIDAAIAAVVTIQARSMAADTSGDLREAYASARLELGWPQIRTGTP